MDQLVTNRHLLYEIVMNADLLDLYLLYQTNHTMQAFINEPYTFSSLNKKYHQNATDFYDLVWLYVNDVYKDTAILDAFSHSLNANKWYPNDLVTGGLGSLNDIRINARTLYKHGFKKEIDQLFMDINGKSLEEQNTIYNDWLALMKIKIISYIIQTKNYIHKSDIYFQSNWLI